MVPLRFMVPRLPQDDSRAASHAWRRARAPLAGLPLAALLAACQASGADRPALERGAIAFSPCQLESPGLNTRVAAQCGRLAVPEDPADPEGPTLELQVALIPAVSRRPEPDPLFFLAGGPGQAAGEAYPAMAAAFAELHRERDIVLVDQRGTGQSGRLHCPGSPPELEPELEPEYDPERIARWARTCLRGLDANLHHYTTEATVADLEAVRQALALERINLYGISYGTRLALAYARRHPEQTRTLVLDGVLPPEVPLGATAARDAQAALDRILDRCARDGGCNRAFPQVKRSLPALMNALDEAPMTVALAHPRDAQATTLELDRARTASVLRFASYSPELAALIPYFLHAAESEENPVPIAASWLRDVEALESSIATGLHYSVLCAEDWPRFDPATLEAVNAETYLGGLVAESVDAVCRVWPAGEAPADAAEPLRSDIPTLLLSGADDPVTPPVYGAQVARTLSRSRHLVAPGMGHGVAARGCLPDLIADFVAAGAAEGLDAGCVEDIAPPGFFLNPNGPAAAPTETTASGAGPVPIAGGARDPRARAAPARSA